MSLHPQCLYGITCSQRVCWETGNGSAEIIADNAAQESVVPDDQTRPEEAVFAPPKYPRQRTGEKSVPMSLRVFF
jgi:hypothetical protein